MKRLVVDSSVVIKWFVSEPYSDRARRILTEYQQGDVDLLAPDLLSAEVGNIVWKKHRLVGMSLADAQLIVDEISVLPIRQVPAAAVLQQAFDLAITHQRTVYDMLYVALSIQEDCQFVTADERLVHAVGTDLPQVVWLADWL